MSMDNLYLFSKIKNLPLVSSKLVEGLLSGNYRSVFKGPGLEFDEVREYVYEDDIRAIDWNVSSRMGDLYTKKFKEERELVLFLIIDVSASLKSGTAAVNKEDTSGIIAALLAFAAVQNNDRVGAIFFSDRIEKWVPPMKGKKHILRLVQNMTTLQPHGKGSDFELALSTVYKSLKRRGICIVLSDFKISGGWRELTLLGRKHDVIAVKITDPLDISFPVSGLVRLKDPETGAEIYGLGRSKKFRKVYHDFWDTQNIFWERECRKRNISTLSISTEEDPVIALYRFFNRRRSR